MIEDKSFNEFIKAKLEEDVGSVPSVDFSRIATSQPTQPSQPSQPSQLLNFSSPRPYLLAASLLIVCGIFAVHFQNSREISREQATVNAIELLDSDLATADTSSYADRLLAWQDAPYAEILD